MKEVDDDDSSSTFRPLAVATASVLSKIEQFEQIRDVNEANADKAAGSERQNREEAKREHRRYVDRRLSDIASFEQRVNGKGFHRRTGRRMKK